MPRHNLSPIALLTLTLVTAVLGACASPSASPSAKSAPAVAAAAHPNVLDTAAASPDLSTFVKLARESGLAAELGQVGSYTVFAPTNEAFQAVPAKTLEHWQNDKAALKDVIGYHVLTTRVNAADVKTGSAKTLQGANVTTGSTAGFATVDDAMVVKADAAASNGVVHTVDRVLLPPKK